MNARRLEQRRDAEDAGASGGPRVAPAPATAPYYRPTHDEVTLFEAAHRRRLPVLLKGPTGCGKTRFVHAMAHRLGRPLVTVACHDDLSASDLTGRFLVRGDETVWQDGPLTAAARAGAICYLDEIVEARPDTIVAIHPLTDDRRVLPLEKTGELVEAHPDFHLVVSMNPGYQNVMKELKPSTRQRFVAIEFTHAAPDVEAEIVRAESGLEAGLARRLVKVAEGVRRLRDRGLPEVPSTRLVVHAAHLVVAGVDPLRACEIAVAEPLTDDAELLAAVRDLARAVLG